MTHEAKDKRKGARARVDAAFRSQEWGGSTAKGGFRDQVWIQRSSVEIRDQWQSEIQGPRPAVDLGAREGFGRRYISGLSWVKTLR